MPQIYRGFNYLSLNLIEGWSLEKTILMIWGVLLFGLRMMVVLGACFEFESTPSI